MATSVAEKDLRTTRKIPIKNLWLLMLWASDLYQQLSTRQVDVEDNPEDIPDLIAEILCAQVERRLMRNLSFGYQNKVAVRPRVKGRIDLLYTESHRLLEQAKVCCRYDELTVNTPRNRYVRAALEKLHLIVIERKLSHQCRILAMRLDRLGVSQDKPPSYSGKSERWRLQDVEDRIMLYAADLAFSLALPNEEAGRHWLHSPDKERKLHALFEKAIAGFYTVALKGLCNVHEQKTLKWQTTKASDGIGDILPNMKADIVIENKSSSDCLVIDTKYKRITKEYHGEKLDSPNIYQMYAYLRSQEGNPQEPALSTASGMLLHPTIGADVNEAVTIQGRKFIFCTVDLNKEATKIRQQLLAILPDWVIYSSACIG